MKVIKYDASFRIEAIKLAAQGLTLSEISELLGIHRNTMSTWRKRDKNFKKILDEARSQGMNHIIETGLRKLAQGVKREETTTESVDDNDGNPIRRRVRTIEDAPSVKAIEVLARRYAKEYTSDDAAPIVSVLSINHDTASLREVQDMMRQSPIEAVSHDEDTDDDE